MKDGFEIARLLSTPREKCKTCIDWNEGDWDNYPSCVNSHVYDTHRYLLGETDDCKHYFEF